jgi:membrane fusion protein (multidrug efflux system)
MTLIEDSSSQISALRSRRRRAVASLPLLCALVSAQTIELVPVVQKPVSRTITLPGELEPFLSVALQARVPGFVERVLVDRGSIVRQGDLLIELSAPEMDARIAEARSKVQAADSERIEAEAQRGAAQSTLDRLKKAAETPGAIAGNEITIAQKQVDALDALVKAREQSRSAATAAVNSLTDLKSYLKITAPFDGVITERLIHPGALAGNGPLLNLQQLTRLRLVVAVPEEDVSSTANGTRVEFSVPAYPDRTFVGTIARASRALDPKTRTMPVELDVVNSDGSLSPGMFPAVKWPVNRARPSLYVPKTSVVSTTERVFVIRNKDGKAEWINVTRGVSDGDLVEVTGTALRPGNMIVKRATDEIREGSPIASKR